MLLVLVPLMAAKPVWIRLVVALMVAVGGEAPVVACARSLVAVTELARMVLKRFTVALALVMPLAVSEPMLKTAPPSVVAVLPSRVALMSVTVPLRLNNPPPNPLPAAAGQPAAPPLAVLPEKVQLVMTTVPALLKTAPPMPAPPPPGPPLCPA